MPRVRTGAAARPAGEAQRRLPSRAESAKYTYDMLISLRKLPALQDQKQLIRLIEAAATEAQTLAGKEPA